MMDPDRIRVSLWKRVKKGTKIEYVKVYEEVSLAYAAQYLAKPKYLLGWMLKDNDTVEGRHYAIRKHAPFDTE